MSSYLPGKPSHHPPSFATMNAAPGVETLKSPIEHSCDNCGRAVTQDGRAVVTDAGKVFCEMNCYWSDVLDVNNSRHRARRRALKDKPRRKRPIRQPVDVSAFTPLNNVADQQFFNAMFAFHQQTVGGSSFGGGHNTPYLLTSGMRHASIASLQ